MESRQLTATLLSIGLMSVAVDVALGQTYPSRPIRFVDGPIGGASDYFARFIGQGIAGPLGQPIIVDNRSGVIAGQVVSQASPDGYTFILAAGTFWIGPLFQSKVPYDVVRDFTPVSMTNRSPNVLVVHPSLPVNSVKELIDL